MRLYSLTLLPISPNLKLMPFHKKTCDKLHVTSDKKLKSIVKCSGEAGSNVRKSSGFTLIELLVVIAIIGILAAFAFASFTSAQARARDAQRKSDFNQLQKALQAFYNDHGRYPTSFAPNNDFSAVGSWSDGGTTLNANWSAQGTTGNTRDNWLNLFGTPPTGYMKKIPVDPKNIDIGPWPWQWNSAIPVNYGYAYLSDASGSHYILAGWLENTSDSKVISNNDVPDPWNPSKLLYRDQGWAGKYTYVVTDQ